MNRKLSRVMWWPFLFAALILSFVQCNNDEDSPDIIIEVDTNGYSSFQQGELQNALAQMPIEDLSAGEEAGLLFMREEEKLAHDIYVLFFSEWNNRVFDNIAASELTHTDAVKALLDRYDLVNPVGSNGQGVFTNTVLQDLYNTLSADGLTNEIEALKVSCAVEEIDILDLREQINQVVDNADIRFVYENLQRASRNHLRAFAGNLENRGVNYVPQYLPLEDYNEIVEKGIETGR